MDAVLNPTDVAWGRQWAADPENGDMLRRLANAVEDVQLEYRFTRGDVEGAARCLLDLMNQDANGAGTLLANAMTHDDEDDDNSDWLYRGDAWDFWEAAAGPGLDRDEVDTIMYGNADHDRGFTGYGNGPLVGFIMGALEQADMS